MTTDAVIRAEASEILASCLLLLGSLQNLFGAAHELVFIFDLLLQNHQLHLQLGDQALLLVDLCVKGAVLPSQREDLLLQPLALLDTQWL